MNFPCNAGIDRPNRSAATQKLDRHQCQNSELTIDLTQHADLLAERICVLQLVQHPSHKMCQTESAARTCKQYYAERFIFLTRHLNQPDRTDAVPSEAQSTSPSPDTCTIHKPFATGELTARLRVVNPYDCTDSPNALERRTTSEQLKLRELTNPARSHVPNNADFPGNLSTCSGTDDSGASRSP